MRFKDRTEAGTLLASRLLKYKNKAVVYGLPRGGTVIAREIALKLNSPLSLIVTRKIGHPTQPEFAIGAIAADGDFIGNEEEIKLVNKEWLEKEKEIERAEAKRRQEKYLGSVIHFFSKDKVTILVDDGVATGYTIRLGIIELRHIFPKKIIVATPVIPFDISLIIKREADELSALLIPQNNKFLGAVGAYYDRFPQVEDTSVINIIKEVNYRV